MPLVATNTTTNDDKNTSTSDNEAVPVRGWVEVNHVCACARAGGLDESLKIFFAAYGGET